jgi:hypothetical protein
MSVETARNLTPEGLLKLQKQLAITSQAATPTRHRFTDINSAPVDSVTFSTRPTIPSIEPLDPEPLKPAPLEPAPPSEFSFNTTKNPIEKPPIKGIEDYITCINIFHTGKKVNSKYSYPSQFPNLTKSHSLTTTIKGGKKKKTNKKSEKNKKGLKMSNHIA